MNENSLFDKKSLKSLTINNPNWDEIAKDCVSFANAFGGRIVFGIEDNDELPPKGQKIPEELISKLSKQIQNRTINVSVIPQLKKAENDAEYIELLIQRNASAIASTSNGRYYIRINDDSKPLLPDELSRLLTDKGAFVWETQTNLKINKNEYDFNKMEKFLYDIQKSDRITNFIKEKTIQELLEYYFMISGDYLTNLGVLWIGKREHRARLLYSPLVQFIKYDENERKVNKILWDDYSNNPKEIIQSIMNDIPDWKEGIEISDGIFRKNIFNYDEEVIRELVVNALVHRPYTIRGDIFINLYPDRLEIHNPGLFPLGVTPQNILHKSIQRNPHLAKLFYDLKIMEKEGSGYDKIYETLLSNGKPLPEPLEEFDRVKVTIRKRIINKDVIQFIDKVNLEFQLKSKEIISLGLIAQNTKLTAIEFSKLLGLIDKDDTRIWLGRLLDYNLIKSKGRTKGKEYFVNPIILKKHKYKGLTDLKNIPSHRLAALIIEDLSRYNKSSISDIHKRIGNEIPLRTLRYQINKLIEEGKLFKEGINKGTKYFIDK
ncbi:MAG: ATP-binding protein [Bacteroidales bacterium]|jgi:ATP-dependent DNA helicase RecG|nr:ATP-binding protein [Bacteroidales bacterium]MDD3286949.1 ATP-binding protein [Bacteroidales bacterium]